VTDTRRMSTRMPLAVALLALAAMPWIACREGARITGPTEPKTPLVVSEAQAIVPGALGAIAAERAVVGAATTDVAYVSLPPGTIDDAAAATVRNVSRSVQTTVTVIDGGFDPIPIAAEAGDTIEVDPQGGAGQPMSVVVPVRRPPQLVRSYPLHGKRDVALNSRIIVVFSEPLDKQTVNESTVLLMRSDVVVSGHVAIDDVGITIGFVPDTPLVPGTDYEIVVTEGVRSLDGEHLQSDVRVDFTTSALDLSVQRIAFYDQHAIYVINSDGSGLQRLIVGDPSREFAVQHPAWSPDGSKIAFDAWRDNNWDIYVMNADGSNVTRLTAEPAVDVSADWSPDGKQIVFTSNRGEGWQNLYVMDIDGTNVKRLTNGPANDDNPVWSPDGRRIAFSSDRVGGGDREIYVMNADGSGVDRLTFDPDPNDLPDWSPDGSLIAYQRYEPTGTGAVYIMSSGGAGAKRMTNGGGGPSWSPDGKFIVYSASNLYIMKADGTGVSRVSYLQAFEPAWSPR